MVRSLKIQVEKSLTNDKRLPKVNWYSTYAHYICKYSIKNMNKDTKAKAEIFDI